MSERAVEKHLNHIDDDVFNGDLTNGDLITLVAGIKNRLEMKKMQDALDKIMAERGVQKVEARRKPETDMKIGGIIMKVGIPDDLGDCVTQDPKEIIKMLETLKEKNKQMCKECPDAKNCRNRF